MQVECINSANGMRDVAAEWAALWRRVPDATPFQSPAWLLAWWRQFGTDAPRLLLARAGGELVGVLPLFELPEPGCRKLLPLGIGLSDYCDALVSPEQPGVAEALLAALADIADWQECHLPELPPGAALALAAAPSGLDETRADGGPCPVLSLPDDPDALANVVPKKTLRDCRQAAARAAAAGAVAIQRAESEDVPAAIEDLFRLHAARWHSRGEGGVLADPQVQAFHRAAAPALDRAGILRLYRLRIGGAVAAVYYGFSAKGRAYAYLGGFDPDLPRLSPGALILHHAIGEAIRDGDREFHFLRGGEAYKYAWGAVDRCNTARTLRRP